MCEEDCPGRKQLRVVRRRGLDQVGCVVLVSLLPTVLLCVRSLAALSTRARCSRDTTEFSVWELELGGK